MGNDKIKGGDNQPLPNVHLWSRDGFIGQAAIGIQPEYTPDFISAEGLHVPRQFQVEQFACADESDPNALPTPILVSRKQDATISVSRRREPMPFTLKNVEADELHFIQRGSVLFETEFGEIEAGESDFVCIPRAAAYRMTPNTDDFIDVIVESAGALKFDTPAPFGMIDFGQDVRRAVITNPSQTAPTQDGNHILIMKATDGITRYVKPVDPLATLNQVGGDAPVWAINLTAIQQISYGGLGGPPAQFLGTKDSAVLMYDLSSRPSKLRPPVHDNADYDEIIYYVRGPGQYGAITEPGTLTCVPKGVTHHGPDEDVPEGYQAWLLETHSTMRFTPEALKQAKLMETSGYGPHPSLGE